MNKGTEVTCMTTGNATSRREAGFTLVEALIAMVILMFGLVAVTNLFLVAGSSNTVGNHSSVATTQAAEVMDRLRGIEYRALTDVGGGNGGGDTITGNGPVCLEPAANCVVPGTYEMTRTVPGVGTFTTSWAITPLNFPRTVALGVVLNPLPPNNILCPANAAGFRAFAIVVHTESNSPLTRRRAAAELTTIRACTTDGCPGIRTCS
jgi:type II secretory pathway pseudopilin PulG